MLIPSRLNALAILAGIGYSTALTTTESSTHFTLANDHLTVAFSKSSGHIEDVLLDGQDLLGPVDGNTGKGPYLDCSCTPDGFWTPGETADLELVNGTDSTGTPYVGVIMTDTYASTNQTLSQYLFLRGS